ncbi:MAG: metallophosphoesterase [Thermoguttaceae bacterium]|nr:metallophosphoesterase [Thermoguttaceae bacterium]
MLFKLSMICKTPIFCILLPSLIVHGSLKPLFAQVPEEVKQTALRFGKLLGPKPYVKPPDWANPDAPLLFSFAWLTDMHLDGSNHQQMEKTLGWIRQELKPTFLLLTGDNSAFVPAGGGSGQPVLRNLRRQQYLQQWLAEHWKGPYAIIPGDNWPEGFEGVFGPRQYRLACGGLHLLMLAPDAMHHGPGLEGLSAFDPETLDWLRKDLEKYRLHPTLVAIHEPIYPPTFIDAPRVRKILKEFPQVIGVLQGHLHIDLELRDGQQQYLVAPAVGPGLPPAFKYLQVYRHILIIRTAELDPKSGQWRLANKWQKIHIPPPFQQVLEPVAEASHSTSRSDSRMASGTESPSWPGRQKPLLILSWRPPQPVRDDPALVRRANELLEAIRQFLWKETPRLWMEAAGR